MTQEVGRDRCRAGHRSGCSNESVQDMTPYICQDRGRAGYLTGCSNESAHVMTKLIDQDRARAGYRTGCATGSEQDMVPEVVRKTPMTGSQTRGVYRARAKLRIEKDVTPELDREQG